MIPHRHPADDILQFQNPPGIDDFLDPGVLDAGRALEDFEFFIALGIVDHHHEHESVKLGFGQADRCLPARSDFALPGRKNGLGRSSVWPPAVTWRSCIA